MTSRIDDSGADPMAPPPNFSWIVKGKLAGMGWPSTVENINYLVNEQISHLVTLSPEKLPPLNCTSPMEMTWSLIQIPEFDVPTIAQIDEFIDLCRNCNAQNKKVGVHCRQGRGRTGTMAACYLVYFENLAPQRAIMNIRLSRPGSVETYRQEKIVEEYHDHLRKSC